MICCFQRHPTNPKITGSTYYYYYCDLWIVWFIITLYYLLYLLLSPRGSSVYDIIYNNITLHIVHHKPIDIYIYDVYVYTLYNRIFIPQNVIKKKNFFPSFSKHALRNLNTFLVFSFLCPRKPSYSVRPNTRRPGRRPIYII